MVVNHRQLFDNLSDAKKRKSAIEWCMSLLRQDFDIMTEREFFKFVLAYECLVEYPMTSVGYYSWVNDDDERDIKDEFKVFQQAARQIISDFEKMKDKPGQFLKTTSMGFTVRLNRQGIYSFIESNEHNFEYSYARQIARALTGKTFDDVFKKCAKCNRYFAILSNHPKEYCDHKCAVRHNNKKISEANPPLAKKQGNLESQFSRLRKKGYTDKELQSLLRRYIKQKEYQPEEIPRYIHKFLGNIM